MKVRDIMTANVLTIPEDSTVEDAARVMRDRNVGLLPIGDRLHIAGVISDRDLTIRVIAASKDPKRTPVREAMSTDNAYCFDDQDVEDACFMMEEKHMRRLLVLDRQLGLVGILSLDDVAARGKKEKLAGIALSKLAREA